MKAHDAMFLVHGVEDDKPARLKVVSREAYLKKGVSIDCDYTFGAVFAKWADIPYDEIMECVLWTGLELARDYSVPITEVSRELAKIDGFTEYRNQIGRLSGALF